ncbi:uncharacterized protein LOC116347375 [Contarinia nasturtii]|uniref:uncharacterized protein LOC116347375 n=1 Tax=Contarinia nasturtii TaxID=265458 RepID=UPI0012D4AE4C|nr:uncharacterized protein LOC116347375 [Contarinia nasturtii]
MGNKQSQATVFAPLDSESSKIFNLTIDCFDEIFEYLNVKDLHSFGQTCKRMNKVAGEYFKQNYSSAPKECREDGIYMYCWDKDGVVNKRIQISGFNRFMPCISHYHLSLPKYIKSHINEFESTNHIHLREQRINSIRIKHFKRMLPQLEIVQHRECSMDGDFYDLILKYCKNLKVISVQSSDVGNRKNGKLNWLLQKYPKLERLELRPSDCCLIEELREFFVRNPNVQRFSTSSKFLSKNGDILLSSNAKLDILQVKRCNIISRFPLELLNRLHEQGFYKRLYIYTRSVDEELSTSLASVRGLELLCIWPFDKSYNLAELTNLRELIIYGESSAEDMENLANGLIRLERLYIDWANVNDIMPFIRRSPKLNKIKFIPRDEGVVLKLAMLNAERAKLAGARKIIIYTRDDVFLATKWTTRNGDTNLSFIEIRRADSIKWEHYD